MNDEFEFQPEPFASYSEAEDFEAFDAELADQEWEDEFRRFGRVSARPPGPRLRSAARRPPALRQTTRKPQRPQRPARRRPRPAGRARRPIGSLLAVGSAEPVEQASEYVRWVQLSLNQILKLRLPISGVMDAASRSALRTFQGQQNLPADGIAGPETRKALVEAKAKPSGRSDEPPPSGQRQQPSPTGPAEEPQPPDTSEEPASSGQSAEPAQPEEFEWLGADEFEWESERPPKKSAKASCQARSENVDCPSPGTPDEVLDNFGFDKAATDRVRHTAKIRRLAQQIVASQRSAQAIRTVLIAGHTDRVSDDDYNFKLGWRRAREVLRELCEAIEASSPGLSRSIRFELTSCGERQLKADAQASRRVEIFLRKPGAQPKKPVPPDHSLCGVPKNAGRARSELTQELEELERSSRPQTVRPQLSLFQNASTTSHRNHFQCQAARWARRLGAIASPSAGNCRRPVGPTQYNSGADIIRSIAAVRSCLRRRTEVIHVFGHSGSHGIFGSSAGSVGLYSGTFDAASRQGGARSVTEVPTASLSENVVIVLHGCNMGAGDDNFARALFQHLASRLRNPRVFAHPNSGCAGRDNSWREYSKRSPNGTRRHRSLAPHYSGDGCCS